jgi:CHAT domain-containing protein/predicted negative regulator of RcsB-dependent stress response
MCLLFSAGTALAQDVMELKQGATVERSLSGGQAHDYRVHLESGQFFHAVVEQHGIDVEVLFTGPDGKTIGHIDSPNSEWGPEPMVAVSEVAGDYRLRVSSGNPQSAPGKYILRVVTIRQATSQDRNNVTANRAFEEATDSLAQPTADSLKAATEQLRAALQFYKSAGQQYAEGITVFTLGLVSAQSGDFHAAVRYDDECLQIFRSMHDSNMQGSTLINLGGAHDVLGDGPAALQAYQEALPLLRAKGERVNEAVALNNIGKIYADMADSQAALEQYRLALPKLHQVGFLDREAITQANVAAIDYLLGDTDKALSEFQQALSLNRKAGNKRGEADTLVQMGNAYQKLDRTQESIQAYEDALKITQTIGDHWREGKTLSGLGYSYFLRGDRVKALDALQQSLKLLESVNDHRGQGLALNMLGDVYTSIPQPDKAADSYNQAIKLLEQIGDSNHEAQALLGLARVERDQNQLTAARKHAEEALSLVEQVRSHAGAEQDRASYFATQQSVGEFYIDLLMRMHKQNPAAGYDVDAFNAAERQRARSLLEMLAEARVDFRRGVDPKLLTREHELSGLLNSKAQRLLTPRGAGTEEKAVALKKEISDLEDQYRQLELEIRKSSPEYAAVTQPQPLTLKEIQQQVLDPNTLLLEYSLGEERSYLWLASTEGLKTYELPKRSEIEKQVREVVELLTARGTYVRGELPDQKQARIARAEAELPTAAVQLSKMVLAPAAADLGHKRLVLITDGSLQHVPFAILRVPQHSGAQPPSAANQNQVASAQAGAPALPKSAHYLVEDHEIVSLPSASTIAELRKEVAGRKPAPGLVAVLADPVFEPNDPRVHAAPAEAGKAAKAQKSHNPRNGTADAEQTKAEKAEPVALAGNKPAMSDQIKSQQATAVQSVPTQGDETRILEHLAAADAASSNGQLQIPRLPFTRQEADSIMKVASAKNSLEALDFRASLATATSPELGRYRYLHFATHGYLDSEHPELSAIVLSLVNRNGQAEAGFLRANDIYNLKLRADLVVLSACETGLGKEIRGEGIVGLTRGFMYAGVPRVIVSLWSVNDRATEELMAAFYQKLLRDKLPPAEALRQAQIAMLRNPRWSSPYYWAAFVQQGEWR